MGKKIRIIGIYNTNRSSQVNIVIDGILYNYTNFNSLQYQTILFEKIDLNSQMHTVEIYNATSDGYIELDRIDIGDTDYLLNPIPIPVYLIKDGFDIKTIKNENLELICNSNDNINTIDNAFDTNGLRGLIEWNTRLNDQIFNNTFTIWMIKKYIE